MWDFLSYCLPDRDQQVQRVDVGPEALSHAEAQLYGEAQLHVETVVEADSQSLS